MSYLLGLQFLVDLRAQNKQSPSVKSVSKSLDHISNLRAIKKFFTIL